MWDSLTPSQINELLDTSPDPLLVLDDAGRPAAANAALRNLLGAGPYAAGDMLDAAHPLVAAGDNPVSYTRPDGNCLELQVHRSTLADGRQALWFRDVSEQRRLQQELAEQSLTEPVTGLLNTRGLLVALEPQVARSRRYDNPLSVVMLEVHGSAVDGDALVRVSRILKDQMRWADMIGCNEHRQFILALPETREADALKLIEKLQARLAAELEGMDVSPVFGMAEWHKADNVHTLLGRAAGALQPALDSTAAAGR